MVQFKVGSVPEHFTLPWHLAREAEAFQKQGISINWQDYPGGTGAMMTDLRTNQLDIAIALTEGVVADIVQHHSSKIAQLFVTTPLTWGIHVAAGAPYQTIEELENKTFAISRMGSGSHLMAYVMGKQRGWATRDIPLKIVGGMDGARQVLEAGDADAFMWEKFMTQPIVDRGEFRRVGEFDTPWPCFVVVVRNDVLENRLEEVRAVLRIVQQSALEFMQHPEATQLIAQRYHLTDADAQAWFARTQWATDFSLDQQMLEKVMLALVDCGTITANVDATQLCSELVLLK